MSLSFWIRDYIFVSLAALRRERWWPYVVFIISMTLFGLWHAAKWTFVLWGTYHGLLLVIHRLGQQIKRQLSITVPGYLGVILAWGTTFSLVSLGWIFFRANDLNTAFSMLKSVFSPSAYLHLAMPSSFYMLTAFVVIAYFSYEGLGTLLAHWRTRYSEELKDVPPLVLRRRFVESSTGVIAFELFEFFAHRMWWWLTPAIFVLTFFISLAMLDRSSVIAITPFMYTIF